MGTVWTELLGEWASQGHGGRFHMQSTHGLVINTQPPHLEQEVLEGPVTPIAGPGSLPALG